MKTKISRLKKDINLLKIRLQHCREIICDKESKKLAKNFLRPHPDFPRTNL